MHDMDQTSERIRALLEGFLSSGGIDLVDVICRQERGDLSLRVLVDYPAGGIILEDCAALNREICAMLDTGDIVGQEGGYTLEVSSPGLDRLLKSRKDFLRCKDKAVKFFLFEAVEGRIEWDAVIETADEEAVYANSAGRRLRIPLSKINKARQVF